MAFPKCLLWVKSAFSFRYGTDTPEALAEAAHRAGFQGVMMADLGGVYGLHRMALACGRLGLKVVTGAHLALPGGMLVTGALKGGWGQFCRLITSTHLPGRVEPELAIADSDRLFAIVSSGAESAGKLREAGFRGRIYHPVLPGETVPALPRGVLPVAASPCMFARTESELVHRILRKVDLLLDEPWVSSDVKPDHLRMLPGAGEWPREALMANEALLEEAADEPRERPYDPPVMGPDDPERLRGILLTRLSALYGGSGAAAARLDQEFTDLAGANLCGYFLAFHEIITYCREKGILAVARGSAGGSLVARLLGLSVVCPIRFGLSFPRFFNPLRSRPPDIDLDIDSTRRDEVFQWLSNRWGGRAAAVSAVGSYRSRSAVRFSATASGLGPDEVEVLARAAGNPSEPVWRRGANGSILENAGLLSGLPAGIGPHPCGMVLCNGSAASRVPLQGCAGGLEVTQFDKDGVEFIGLLKMDLLGHRGLSAIAAASGGEAPELMGEVGSLDGPTLALLNRGATIGVPHIESPAMRGLLREMTIRDIEDVARALALVRPGASAGGGRAAYRSGGDTRTPECLRNLLGENRGVMLYQEDVSEAACILMGLPAARGDLMRRRLKAGQIAREEVVDLCLSAGHSPETARRGWELLSGYAGYGFCKAHAMTYAFEACVFAGLKARRPAHAMAAFMAAGGGFYTQAVYVEEARRMGIRIVSPGVNTGGWLCRATEEGSLMLGMGLIKGMGESEFGKVRQARPFLSPAGVRDAGIGPVLASAMAMAGCFDELGVSRPEAVWAVKSRATGLFPEGVPPPQLPEYTSAYRVRAEILVMGITTAVHPLEVLERPRDTVPVSEASGTGTFRLWGRITAARSLGGGAGFLMLEDPTGVQDIFLPSPLYRDAELFLRRDGATLVIQCKADAGARITAAGVLPGPILG
jgi:DNA polymerase III alpha subunit